MTPELWEKVSEIYHDARERAAGAARAAYLDEACGADAALRAEVEALLAADEAAGSFINQPAVKDFSPLLTTELALPLAGRSLGHYRIVSRLGAGGMGDVYLAEDTRLGRRVALKTLPVSYVRDENYLRRFQTEAQAAATLNHPHVATVYSVEEVDGQPFITMEYVEGRTLDAFTPRGGVDLETFLEWFLPLSDALAHAHDNGVIHRDIKPHNIMMTSGGTPKILDFGLAQIRKSALNPNADDTSTLSMTDPGQILGTPSYMSPEQAEGRTVDHRSDVFSFGVVMYEALTGERPFKGDSYASLVSEVLSKEPRAISEIRPATPYLLSRLISRCLEKDRRRRFQSMREVRVILEEMKAANEAGVSLDSGSVPHLSRQERGGKWPLAVAAGLLAALLLAAGVAVYRYWPGRAAAPSLSFANVALRKLSQGSNVVFAHVMPDGKSIAYYTIDEGDGRSLWVRRVDDKNSLQLSPTQPVQFWGGLSSSPDGSQLFYITAARNAPYGTLYRISTLGGAPRKLVERVNDLGSLSPDGSRVLYVRYGYGDKMRLLAANASDGGDERVVYELDDKYIFRDPQYSLDGKSVFLIKFERIDGEEFWSLVEVPADGGSRPEKIILPPRKPRISEVIVLKDGSGLVVNAYDAFSNLPQLYHVSLPDGRETRITNDLNAYFGLSASDDGRTLVTAQRNEEKEIWTTGDGPAGSLKKLTNEFNVHSTAQWTPDGRLVFDAVDNNRPHIWIMNADGSGAQQLTPNDSDDYEPRATPDGRYIVFTSRRSGETKLWRMNLDGTNPQLLTPVGGATFGPVLVPGRNAVLFQWVREKGRVWGQISLDGGEIAEYSLASFNRTAVSPDGAQLANVFYDEPNRRFKLRVRPFAAAEPEKIFDVAPTLFVAWTNDGKGLFYRPLDGREANSTVMLQMLAGGPPRPFLSVAPDSVFSLSQSADGKKIAVVRGQLLSDAVMLTKVKE